MALDYVGTDVPASFGDSFKQLSNYSTTCSAGPVLRTVEQYLMAFCSRPKAASDVVSGRFVKPLVIDTVVKFCHPRLNHSREIPRDFSQHFYLVVYFDF